MSADAAAERRLNHSIKNYIWTNSTLIGNLTFCSKLLTRVSTCSEAIRYNLNVLFWISGYHQHIIYPSIHLADNLGMSDLHKAGYPLEIHFKIP